MEEQLTQLYTQWLAREGLPEVDAEELALDPSITQAQRDWLAAFIQLWRVSVR